LAAPLTLAALVILGAALWLYAQGFYALPLEERPEHDLFRALRPTGLIGQGYGVIGTALIFANLAYLIRKRLARFPLGSMRTWLNGHVLTGLVGSTLILFHSAFQMRNMIAATTAGSLGVVIVTGLVGRYLFAMVPKADTDRLHSSLDGLDELVPGFADAARGSLAALPAPTALPAGAGLLRTLITLPTWMTEARARKRAVRDVVKTHPFPEDAQVARMGKHILRQAASAAASEANAAGARHLLRVWRGLHRFFALLMLAAAAIHIAVAWHYGYRWIFSE